MGRFRLTPDGRVFDNLIGKHFSADNPKARRSAAVMARTGDDELYELIVRPTLNGGSIVFPSEIKDKSLHQQAKERAKNYTINKLQKQIPARQAIHTMQNGLQVESALSDDPRLGQALTNRYGNKNFSSDSLIDFVGEGKLLQRQGVDFITPQKQLIDLKLRRPDAAFDDLLTELVSVDTTKLFGTPRHRPATAQGVVDYISNLSGRDKPGWTVDPAKRTDEIVYYQPGLNKISFINAPALRQAMPELLRAQYKARNDRPFFSVARNLDYNTVNMPINYPIVKDILGSDIETIQI